MKRIYYIDWLRISAEVVVLLIHAVSFFHPLDWHVKNSETNNFSLLVFQFLHMWVMPLFFFLAGAATLFFIKKPFGTFLISRIERLLIPLVVGMVILIPPQKYVEALSHHVFSGGYFEFMKAYFSGDARLFPFGIHFSLGFINFSSYHLWFLVHLVIISILLFPLMYLVYNKGARFLDKMNMLISFKGGAILLFIPIAVVYVFMKRIFPDFTGWGDLSRNAGYFMLGFMCIRHEGLRQSILNSRVVALIPAGIVTIFYLMSFLPGQLVLSQLLQNNQVYGFFVFRESLVTLATWSWVLFFIGTGMKYLNVESRYRPALNELVLPFYMLHQTVLLLIGYIVVQWDWNMLSKFVFIFTSSFFVILAIYIVAIRPFNVLRYLFGMSKLKKNANLAVSLNSQAQVAPVVDVLGKE